MKEGRRGTTDERHRGGPGPLWWAVPAFLGLNLTVALLAYWPLISIALAFKQTKADLIGPPERILDDGGFAAVAYFFVAALIFIAPPFIFGNGAILKRVPWPSLPHWSIAVLLVLLPVFLELAAPRTFPDLWYWIFN